jgi:hypothetical protein
VDQHLCAIAQGRQEWRHVLSMEDAQPFREPYRCGPQKSWQRYPCRLRLCSTKPL